MSAEWVLHDPHFVCDDINPELRVGPWAGHRWFGYDLVAFHRPRRLVELGSELGASFFAFAQAVADGAIDCELHAIDVWGGFEDHGFQGGDEIYRRFNEVADQRFPTLPIRRHRMLFDDAVERFDDGSIDLLHIDGVHTYDATLHDFELWRPKLSERAIVLFHDTAASTGLGSAQVWDEMCARFPHTLDFRHSYGLGVLLLGPEVDVDSILGLANDHRHSWYEHRWGHWIGEIARRDLTTMVEERDDHVSGLGAEVDELRAGLADAAEEAKQLHGLIASRDADLASLRADADALVDEKDAAIAATAALVDERDRYVAELEDRVDGTERALHEAAVRHEADLRAAAVRERELIAVVSEATRRRRLPSPSRLLAAGRRGASFGRRAAIAARRRAVGKARRVVPIGVRTRPEVRRVVAAFRTRTLVPAGRPLDAGQLHSYAAMVDAEFYGARIGVPPSAATAEHYRQNGSPLDMAPNLLFDIDHYLEQHPEAAGDALAHYVTEGRAAGSSPHPLFDPAHYLATYGDVAAAHLDPYEHFITHGQAEQRSPHPSIDLVEYGRINAEAQPEPTTLLEHYVQFGLTVGLPLTADASVTADAEPAGRSGTDWWPSDDDLELARAAELVTFDLWDTLIERNRPADSAKLATCDHLVAVAGTRLRTGLDTSRALYVRRRAIEESIADSAAASGLSREYDVQVVLRALLDEAVDAPDGELDQMAAELVDAEIDAEIRHCAVRPGPMRLLEQARAGQATVAVVSDFYMGAARLRRIMEGLGIDLAGVEVFSSADSGETKHDQGRLFSVVRDKLEWGGQRHLHVGDNPHSDGAMALSVGAEVVLVEARPIEPLPGQLDPAHTDAIGDRLIEAADGAAALARPAGDRQRKQSFEAGLEDAARIAGAAFAPAPVVVVAAAIAEAERLGVPEVHYLSREGAYLKSLHDRIGSRLARGALPAANHLAVSRRSTFGPSLSSLERDELMRMWTMYPNQSPRGFLVSLGLDPVDLEQAPADIGLAPETVVEQLCSHEGFLSLLAGPWGLRVWDAMQQQRDGLRSYLDSEITGSATVVVDVGWRGSIQDNLAHARPDITWHGVYLGLFEFLVPQRSNTTKSAVAFDANKGDDVSLIDPVSPIEMLFSSPEPSTVGYRVEDGAVHPILDEANTSSERGARLVTRFQEGVALAAPGVADFVHGAGGPTWQFRIALQRLLADVLHDPHPGAVDLYFESLHDESFGVLNELPWAERRPSAVDLAALHRGPLTSVVDAWASASRWPAGYRKWAPVAALGELFGASPR